MTASDMTVQKAADAIINTHRPLKTDFGKAVFIHHNDGFRDDFLPLYRRDDMLYTVSYMLGSQWMQAQNPYRGNLYVVEDPALLLQKGAAEKDGSYATFSGGMIKCPPGMREATEEEARKVRAIVLPGAAPLLAI